MLHESIVDKADAGAAVELRAARAPVGGVASVVLGTEDPKKALLESQQQRDAIVDTPDAAPRFPQAPGGSSTMCFGESVPELVATRDPVGGRTTLLLGTESARDSFDQQKQQRATVVPTPAAAPRFPQAPGGTSSIDFGVQDDLGATISTRGAVGGETTLTLGDMDSRNAFSHHDEQRAKLVNTPDAAPRFPQAPGGYSSVSLGGDGVVAVPATKGPVGGPTTVTLGTEVASEVFSERHQRLVTVPETPSALPRFPQAPGGTSTMDFGEHGVCTIPATRGPVGGAVTMVQGTEDPSEMFKHHKEQQGMVVETPDAALRFPQAPGGDSTMDLGGKDGVCMVPATRGPVGGAVTMVLGAEDPSEAFNQHKQQRDVVVETPDAVSRFPQAPGGTSTMALGGDLTPVDTPATKGPVGGSTTVVLGTQDASEAFDHHRQQCAAVVDTPSAAPRFPQAPGGTSSVNFSGADFIATAPATRGPVGGAVTMTLGTDDPMEAFSQHRQRLETVIATPDAKPRFPHAPGGSTSIQFGGDLVSSDVPAFARPVGGADSVDFGAKGDTSIHIPRGPIGGEVTLDLGQESAADFFNYRLRTRQGPAETPEAAPRFPQAPGGTASICFGDTTEVGFEPRGAVGGPSTLLLGSEDPAETFSMCASRLQMTSAETPAPVARFPQAPGGSAAICLGGEECPVPMPVENNTRSVGGKATVVLGIDEPADAFKHRIESQAIETPLGAPRFPQAPGGTTSVCLGGGVFESCDVDEQRQAPGGTSTLVLGGDYPNDKLDTFCSSNKFACGTSQNSGNVITERPTTRLHQAPGGSSTLVLGGDYPNDHLDALREKVSSNMFASAASQNSGNVLTERSSTRLHQAPGGDSSLQLGGNAPPAAPLAAVSSNKFANAASQNCGNGITDRPTTRVHQAPGGNSSLSFGSSCEKTASAAANVADENVDDGNVQATPAPLVVG